MYIILKFGENSFWGRRKMKKIMAIMMFGALSLMSAPSGAAVTEGDFSAGPSFAKGCDTGVFSYVVREGHLARMYIDHRRTLNSRMRVSANGDILKMIDRAKMVAVKFKGADGVEVTGFTTFFFGLNSASDREYDPGNWHGCD